jgi:16S rRNA (uracil1498-N3)-methyltransferase
VADVLPLGDALRRAAGRRLLAATPGAGATLVEARAGAERVAVVVGPEGGLAPEEEALVVEAGAVRFGLGPLVLRVETAALVAVHLASV